MNPEASSAPGATAPQQQQQQQIPVVGLQPLFDTSSLASHEGDKADSARVLSPPSLQQQQQQQQQQHTQQFRKVSANASIQAQLGTSNSDVFGRLPLNDSNAGTSRIPSTSGGSGGHGRTASYGTSLLDTLNEERQFQQQRLAHPALAQRSRLGHNRSATGCDDVSAFDSIISVSSSTAASSLSHHRHFTLATSGAGGAFQTASPFSLLGQGDANNSLRLTSSSLSPPNPAGASTATRNAAHIRSHTLTASPPGFGSSSAGGVAASTAKAGNGLLKQPLPTNASGILGAHARLNSISSLSSIGGGTSNASSALASSGLTSGLAGSSLLASSSLRNSYSSNSLRSAFARKNSPSPLAAAAAAGEAKITANGSFDFGSSLEENVWGPSGLSSELDLLTLMDEGHGGIADRESGEGGESSSRIRSYSFNGPPDGSEETEEPDIDVLHAAATSQNPVVAFRKMMARTHSRSKTLANPFGGEGDADYASGFQQQQQQPQQPGQRYNLPMHMRSTTLGNSAGSSILYGSQKSHRRTGTGSSIAPSTLELLQSSLAGIGGAHSKQSSEGSNPDAQTVHIGIGGESVRGFTRNASITGLAQRSTASASHSRRGSMHTRQHSIDLDFSMAHAADGVPTRSLWVGNVDPGLSNQDLIAIFGKYGRVESLRLLPDKECAFVNFLRVEDAIRAKEDMHSGARIGNNTVRVGFGKGESYATGDAQAMQPTRALWIGNIATATTPETLQAAFEPFGTIESARVLSHKNCGFVNFIRLEDAVRAKQAMNGKSIDGSVVRIGYAKVPAAKNESSLKLRNPVPSAAPLTVSGQIAEADAITGTTQRGLGSDMVLEPGFTLAIDEDLVAFPYATQLPSLPEPTAVFRSDNDASSSSTSTPAGSNTGDRQLPSVPQARLREVRKLMEAIGVSPISKAEFDRLTEEMMPYAVELCTDYVGNVIIQKIAERGNKAQKLELTRRVGPHMTSIGVHKNGTWAVQKIIDTANSDEQRRIIVESIKPFTPQLLLDQLGNYVVQCCLRFGPTSAASKAKKAASPKEKGGDELNAEDGDAAAKEEQRIDLLSTNQFVFDAIHARCMEVAQGRFGARAIRTCLESSHASKLQQKLVAVALVTNAVSLATNSNGHLLINWLLDSSKFSGRYRVLAHQLAPHLRYLATHKLGSTTVTKILDQAAEPDARDLILNTLFFNPDPSVLDDVILDQSHGIHIVLKVLQGSSIGDAEKARIADRLRFLTAEYSSAIGQQQSANDNGGHSSVSPPASGRSSNAPPTQRLADVVASILSRAQPVYPPTLPPAVHRIVATNTATSAVNPAVDALRASDMPVPQHYQSQQQMAQLQPQPQPQPQAPAPAPAPAAMSFPLGPGLNQILPPPAGFGGMVANGQENSLLAALYQQQQQQQQQQQHLDQGNLPLPHMPPPAGFFGSEYAHQPSAIPFYPFGNAAVAAPAGTTELYPGDSGSQPTSSGGQLAEQQGSAKPAAESPSAAANLTNE
ncbi:hypothetical protein GGI12_001668 [Dipsacomyces acuminosporus]|nr:hypothetical protein GGI12_001668 [Dipsacomyces acuminosporus]